MAQLIPPFTHETATKMVKETQALWNTKDPAKIADTFTDDAVVRSRDFFVRGQEEVKKMLTAKWEREKQYRLRKELFLFADNQISTQFWNEYYNEEKQGWSRSYGVEAWTFAEDGRMRKLQLSVNEIAISEEERWFKDGSTEEDINGVSVSEVHW